jgi:Holliday junction resolvase RusA-like endonuclease
VLELGVPGKPEPKGSMRVGRHGGIFSSNPRLKGWQERLALAAAGERDGAGPEQGPLWLHMEFRFVRPPSHRTSKGALRKGAPAYPGRPDLDKLVRGVLDGLTGVLFQDDSQVVELDAVKGYGPTAGVRLVVHGLELDGEGE